MYGYVQCHILVHSTFVLGIVVGDRGLHSCLGSVVVGGLRSWLGADRGLGIVVHIRAWVHINGAGVLVCIFALRQPPEAETGCRGWKPVERP